MLGPQSRESGRGRWKVSESETASSLDRHAKFKLKFDFKVKVRVKLHDCYLMDYKVKVSSLLSIRLWFLNVLLFFLCFDLSFVR